MQGVTLKYFSSIKSRILVAFFDPQKERKAAWKVSDPKNSNLKDPKPVLALWFELRQKLDWNCKISMHYLSDTAV